MPLSRDTIDQEHRPSFPRESLSRFTHDIRDQNYSILMGTDLLLEYWKLLSNCLSEELPESQRSKEYQEILATMPVVINGVRKASLTIDSIIRQEALTKGPHPEPHRGDLHHASSCSGCDRPREKT